MNLVAFLADSLALWQVDGRVEAGAAPVAARICAGDCVVAIERNTDDEAPWRWFVRWTENASARERSRPCASLTGMLNAVRRALNVERGSALRIASAPSGEIPGPANRLGRGQR